MYTSTANGILAVGIAFPLLAALFVALRFAARKLKGTSPQAHDWTIVVSLVFCFGLGINTIIGVVSGALGTPRDKITKTETITLLKIIYADSFLCFTAEAIVKIAILLFYKRIFITKSFNITANAAMTAVIFWHVSSILVLLCSQIPISGHWNPVSNAGHILNFSMFLIANASIDLGLDIVILFLPLPVISRLHLVPRRKLAVVGIFWLGFFCSIAEAVRIYYFHRLLFTNMIAHSDAFGPTVANVLIWSRIEPCCSVIAACLPLMGPIFQTGRSPESLINSIRSYLSNRSIFSLPGDRAQNSSHQNHTKESYELGDRKRWNRLHSSGDTIIERDEIGVLEASRSEPGANEIVVKQSFTSEYGS